MADNGMQIDKDSVITKLKRAFGFGYPAIVVVLHKDKANTDTQEEKYIEDPEIVEEKIYRAPSKLLEERRAMELGVTKKGTTNESKEKEEAKFTIIRDKKNNDLYFIRGEIKRFLKPYKVIDFYPESALTLLAPAFIIYTFILLGMFGAMPLDTITAMLITFLMAMMFFEGKHVYSVGSIYGLDVMYKGKIGGTDMYVPMSREFLTLKETGDKEIIHDAIRALTSYFKPVMAENKLLTEQVNKVADELSKSFLLGLRMRKAYMDMSERFPSWVWVLVGVIIGIIIGLVLSGGIAPAPTEGMPP